MIKIGDIFVINENVYVVLKCSKTFVEYLFLYDLTITRINKLNFDYALASTNSTKL